LDSTGIVFVQQDAIGNITAIVEPVQGVEERYTYDPYGRVTIWSVHEDDPDHRLYWRVRDKTAFGWQYLFQAGRYEPTFGQYGFRTRNLNPQTGTWGQTDTIGYAGGDANLYRFVGDSPTNYRDPGGQIFSWISAGVGALAGLGSYLVSSIISGESMSLGGAVNAALNGAMSGAVAGAAITGDISGAVILGVGLGALGGTGGSILQQGIDNGFSNINWDSVAVGGLSGALGGAAGGLIGGAMSAGISRAVGDKVLSCGVNWGITATAGAANGMAVDAVMQGVDMLAGVQSGWNWGRTVAAGAAGMTSALLSRVCFTAEMLIDGDGGKRRADTIQKGDRLWSRSEFDPDGPLELKEVEEVFVRVSPVLNLHLAGQVIRTTAEHPFSVQGHGWIPAGMLEIGDLLITREGGVTAVEGVADSGEVTTVYNWRIADHHTYFVSATIRGPSVWAPQCRIRQLSCKQEVRYPI
jgi:RHS repeat-associated protein